MNNTVIVLTDESIYSVSNPPGSSRNEPNERIAHSIQYNTPGSLMVDHDAPAMANAIIETLQQAPSKPPTESVTLVIPMNWCMTHVITTEHKTDHQALCYELEEYIPIPLEDVTCAFMSISNGNHLAVALPTQPMAELLNALSTKGLEIDHIVIDAIAVALNHQPENDTQNVVIIDEHWTRKITFTHESGMLNLCSLVATREYIAADQPCDALSRTEEHRLILNLVSHSACSEPEQEVTVSENEEHRLSGHQAVRAIATAAQQSTRHMNLRTGALAAKGRWNATMTLSRQCLVCALVLAIVWVGAMAQRSATLRTQLAETHEQQLGVYQEVFDVETLPPGAALRLASERLRLEGLTQTGNAKNAEGMTSNASPLETLRSIVDALPSDVRIMLTHANLDERQFTLRGQTAEHRDAERIVESINRLEGWNANPPRSTRTTTGGVEFSILATVQPTLSTLKAGHPMNEPSRLSSAKK